MIWARVPDVSRAYEVLKRPARRNPTMGSRGTICRRAAGRVEWLVDEVAIDFPSVSSVLDRMRHAFFGSVPPADLSAEIVLTPREAFLGATVQLGVPLRGTCVPCGGRGETWNEWCPTCGGTGEMRTQHEMHLRMPPRVREGSRFRFSVTPPGAPETVVDVRVSIR